nr:MAG TPA: hypothetical protein [Caudoviricetes sp.]
MLFISFFIITFFYRFLYEKVATSCYLRQEKKTRRFESYFFTGRPNLCGHRIYTVKAILEHGRQSLWEPICGQGQRRPAL